MNIQYLTRKLNKKFVDITRGAGNGRLRQLLQTFPLARLLLCLLNTVEASSSAITLYPMTAIVGQKENRESFHNF